MWYILQDSFMNKKNEKNSIYSKYKLLQYTLPVNFFK